MKGLLSLLFLLGLMSVAFLVIRKLKSRGSGGKSWPVKPKTTLLNLKEQVVFNRLTEALPNHVVLAQVALSQMVTVSAGKDNQWARNKIFMKVIDFVICRPDTGVIAAVELDGNSHDHPRRSKADNDKSAVLDAAGIRLLRMNSKELWNAERIRSELSITTI